MPLFIRQIMYQRILLKLSGEALANEHQTIDASKVKDIVKVIKSLVEQGTQVGIVIGGGNIYRGKLAGELGIDQVPADFMGMTATTINCIALSNALIANGLKSKVFTALPPIRGVSYAYDKDEARKALDEGNVIFFAGGIGKPYFTTDTAASTRALETGCEVILMAKNGVEGIYDKDPRTNPDAKFFKTISYEEVIERKLQVMDITAVELVKDTDLKLRVFSMQNLDNIIRVVNGEDIGTTVGRNL